MNSSAAQRVPGKPERRAGSEAQVFNTSAVAEYYAGLNYLTPCEQLLFDAYLKPGMAILDLGVGGGRTTAHLSSLASRYIGVDCAGEMIAACRKKFPQLEFQVASADDLSRFPSSTLDAAVMAFNGIDCLFPDESRWRALKEISRVLKPGGILIFSSHNPRSVGVRASWNPQRVRNMAEHLVSSGSALFLPVLWCITATRVILAGLQAAWHSLGRVARRLPRGTFWRGQGYWWDPAHGGVHTHYASPENVAQELAGFNFRLLRVLGDDYPRISRPYVTDWYYYVFSKIGVAGER
jgi:SAM-dependent methyltransferase